MKHPRLRDGKRLQTSEPYPINELPDDLLVRIGGYLVHLLYIGRKDISGGDWGDTFADAVGGTHLDSPVGIADVALGKMAWSMKTVKNGNPLSATTVRLISGFTWQPHGAQFTIHAKVLANAARFQIRKPPLLTKEDILKTINFDTDWVRIIR